MEHTKIITIKYAESTLPESAVFQGGRTEKKVPITFVIYLIVTKNRRILVDAGCDTMPGFEMINYERPVDVLGRYGYEPEDITDVVITHAHHDHIAAVGYYKNAVIYVQEDEYMRGRKYIPKDFRVQTFKDMFFVDNSILVKTIGGHSLGSCIVEFRYGEACYVISGDECYARECLTQKKPTGSTCNLKQSEFFVHEYSKDCYQVLMCHEQGIESGVKILD
ncbi:MAG: MBL fold metallo-hydrolase [Lachnospiraceae bacterium]|nr:MBL fold metallo-hydrolase [Lachnospiraceae bacterium]